MTASFGARLRSHRQRRGIDLDEIARTTKIRVGIFQALERDDTSEWPSGIYRRAFIRAYATAVGLDPESTLSEFLERFPDPKDDGCVSVREGGRTGAMPLLSYSVPAEPLRLTLADERHLSIREEVRIHAVPPLSDGVIAEPLRLTVADEPPLSMRSYLRALRSPWLRVAAAACDLAIVFAIAAVVFEVVGAFWIPFTLTTVCYYFFVVIVGTSPVTWVFRRGRPTPTMGHSVAAPDRLSESDRAEADHLTPSGTRRYPRAV